VSYNCLYVNNNNNNNDDDNNNTNGDQKIIMVSLVNSAHVEI
jgi:hypothetical protein